MTTSESKDKPFNFNLPAYILFVTAGISFLYFRDISQAVVFLGLALVFDPFDQSITYQKRPLFQKALLIVHLAIVSALFGFMLSGK